jgi:cephalosporin hydroxylase
MKSAQLFEGEKELRISAYTDASPGIQIGRQVMVESCFNDYTYNFSWMGLPIIQFPQDIVMMQEIIFKIRPDLIIETGIARGGSLVFYASMLELLGKGKVLGVDVEIREENREAIENHPMFKRITLVEGSSTDSSTLTELSTHLDDAKVVLVCLDSKHTHAHVLAELNSYCPFVSVDSYLVIFDTTVETFDKQIVDKLANNYRFKPWGKGSNPSTAVKEFLLSHSEFEVENRWHYKSMITNCWEGVLRRTR